MGEYFDKAYVAADGVILFYEDDDVSLNIPGRLGDMDIHTIGDGAFMESKSLMYAYIPAGVKTLGDKAFYRCRELKSIAVPRTLKEAGENAFGECPYLRTIRIVDFELDEEKYLEYKSRFMCANGSVYIAPSFPDDEQAKALVSAASVEAANPIKDGIIRLFSADSAASSASSGKKLLSLIDKKQESFSFGQRDPYVSELDSVKELIKNPGLYDADIISEEKNDRFLKSDKVPEVQKTAIFTFDDSKTGLKNGKYHILADIMIGYHFWPSVVPVALDGKMYYIYRRHILSGEPGLNYIRHDSGVFSAQGGYVENEEEWLVNAKYRLLSIL